MNSLVMLSNRKRLFSEIRAAYSGLERDLSLHNRLPYKTTLRGCWATSVLDDVFKIFHQVGLDQYQNMVDLGSGDGRVVAVASLFTNATGIEIDRELHEWAVKIKKLLQLNNASFFCDDFSHFLLSSFDFIYIYPDRPQLAVECFMEGKWNGKVMVAGSHFSPGSWRKEKILECSAGRYTLYDVQQH